MDTNLVFDTKCRRITTQGTQSHLPHDTSKLFDACCGSVTGINLNIITYDTLVADLMAGAYGSQNLIILLLPNCDA